MGQVCSPQQAEAEPDTEPATQGATAGAGDQTEEPAKKEEEQEMEESELDDAFDYFDITFNERPFGFGCDQGIENTSLLVTSIQKDFLREKRLKTGALIIGCDQTNFKDMPYEDIIATLHKAGTPCTIHFAMDKGIVEAEDN